MCEGCICLMVFCVKDEQTFYKCGNIKSEKYDTPVAYKCSAVCKDKVSTIWKNHIQKWRLRGVNHGNIRK